MTCTVGMYGFSNVYSASIFSYLNSKGDEFGYEVAKAAVERFELLLARAGALQNAGKLGWLDTATTLNPRSGLIDTYLVALNGIGDATMQAKLYAADDAGNPYPPASGDVEKYVDYAILYWKKYPKTGPAYLLTREFV